MYPLIELATAAIWGYMVWRHGVSLEALRGAVFGTILLGIAMTDARQYIIPDEFTWGGLVIGLLFSLAGGLPGLGTAILGAAVGFGLLWLVGNVGTWVFKEDAMGGGDIKMMAMVGAFLGWQGVLLTVFLGALVGSLVFVPLMLAGQKKLVPFGIFLAVGAAITYEFATGILGWYGQYLVGA
jgi:leader peptidase (prepilin peptidase)/N-methyltransferase